MAINNTVENINNQPTIKPRTVTGIFTKYIAKTLPLAFDESMSYYECLCALLEYLNETIVPDINNTNEGLSELQTFYEKLQSYVNNYFDNLDVQEEINNKLDQMVEDGVLEQIIEQYIQSSAMWCFDSVANMKEATNLINGSYAQTLGYHTINDDGGATYKITDTLPQNELYETLNNGLYAVLIIEDRLNIKQIGAYGDGEHEDSTYFQTANDYFANIIRNSDIAHRNTIEIPAGKYKISTQINLSPYIKLRTIGYVALFSYVSNGSMIHIRPTEADLQHSIGDRHDWYRGPIIEGNSGLIIKYMGQDNSNAIGIEIGLNYELIKGTVARFTIQEFRLQGFNIGILFNRFHVFVGEMRRVSFEKNTIGVQYSDVDTAPIDSGERMSYNECIFARNNIAVKWLCEGFNSNFTNTSFDFVLCVFYDPNNKGYRYINVVQCHFEGIGINNKADATIPSGIVYGQMRSSKINILSSDVYLTYEDYLFYCDSSLQANYILSFTFNNLSYPNGHNKKGNYFLATDNINILDGINNSNSYDESAKFLQLKKMIYYYDFSDMELGEFTFDNTTKQIGKFIAPTKNTEISNTMNIVTSPFGKALQLTKTQSTLIYFRLNTELFPVIGGRSVIVNLCKNIISNTLITIKYYDQNKDLIGQTGDYHYESNQKDGDLYMSDWVKRLYVPSNAYYLEVSWVNVIPADVSNLTIYGLFVEYE